MGFRKALGLFLVAMTMIILSSLHMIHKSHKSTDITHLIDDLPATISAVFPQLPAAPSRKWAYAFLIGGVDPDKPKNYKGMIYNAMVATYILHEAQSAADVVVMIQMSETTAATELPTEDVRILEALNIHIHYLPKPTTKQTFYTVVLEKFRILELVQYSRVLFMDSDIIPFCSLDYLFDMSEPETGPPILKENLVLSWKLEPSNCGFFMLQPGVGLFDELRAIIARQQQESLHLDWPPFDKVRGWGQAIAEPYDYWRNYNEQKGYVWEWHGVFGGQGLLYYWTKYHRKSVSLVTKNEVENWVASNDTGYPVVLEQKHSRIFDDRHCVPKDVSHHKTWASVSGNFAGFYPYRDFVHFVGKAKPWEKKIGKIISHQDKCTSSFEYWYFILKKLNFRLGMGLDVTDLQLGNPALGRYPTYIDMYRNTQRVVNETNTTEAAN